MYVVGPLSCKWVLYSLKLELQAYVGTGICELPKISVFGPEIRFSDTDLNS